jgi:serine/threonine protein kinase/Flp pilus assembly protein TadD
MAESWRQGNPRRAEYFLDLYPGLRESPAAIMDLLFEEVCLCREHGRPVDVPEIVRRFPQWQQQIEILLHCAQALEGQVAPAFPTAGETFGDFHLLAQLGRGGQGIVFAATQSSLGDRPVVLKVTSRRGDEHLSLARLQHTHVVPLLSAMDDPKRNLRVLCMPYLGGMTLAALLTDLRGRAPARRTGQDILQALDTARAAAAIALPPGRGPATPFLASYVVAITWLGACLAEALKYAHERGLVHLDLKPSNVLFTADRQPMLLDFHLAREPVRAGDPGARFGGTPGYMSPEQKRAMAAVKEGNPVPETIDGRSDIYSLGLLLYEALGGDLPGEHQSLFLPLRRSNPAVSPGLSDILAKCLAAQPEDRYQDAGTLAADLWAHLNDMPLKGVANRSIAERFAKLRRRQPHLLRFVGLIGAIVIVTAAAVTIFGMNVNHRVNEARAALDEGRKLTKAGRYADSIAALKRGAAQLENLPWNRALKQHLRDCLAAAARGQAAQGLHETADRFRLLYGVDFFPSAKLQTLEVRCRAFWDKRDLILDRLGKELEPDVEQRLRLDLLDLAILGADLRVRLAGDQERAARQGALQMLSEAEALLGPNAVLYHERRGHALALGLSDLVRETDERAAHYPPRTAWEHYALGRSLVHANNLQAAVDQLKRALVLQPDGLWPSFYHGLCCYRLGRFQDAALSFTTCAALTPKEAGCFYNRGLSFVGLERSDLAMDDLGRALELDPAFGEAAFHRGLLHLRNKHLSKAAADFRRALDSGANPSRAHFQLALICVARQDRAGAVGHLEQSRRFDPAYRDAAELLKKLQDAAK